MRIILPSMSPFKRNKASVKRRIVSLLTLAAFVTSTAILLPDIDVQAAEKKRPTLMDLFKKKKQSVRKPVAVVAPQRVKPVARARKKPAPVKRKLIAAPQYFQYVAAPLVTFKAKALSAKAKPALALGAFTSGLVFSDALAASGDVAVPIEGNIAKALTDFYTKHGDFIWVDGYHISAEANRVLAILNDADSYGLDAQDYAVKVPSDAFDLDAIDERNREMIAFEMSMSAKVLRYVQDVEGQRVDANKLSGYHDLPNKVPALDSVLSSFAESTQDDVLLLGMHPREAMYETLRTALKSLEQGTRERIVLTPRIFLKPGEAHEEFPKFLALIERKASPALRQAFQLEMNLARGTQTYSADLVPLIKAWQKERGLSADGVIGPNTIAQTTDRSKEGEVEKVKLALERMRWLPDQFGTKYVFINQPAYRVDYVENNIKKLSMDVVVGKKSNQTNFFYDEIETVVLNPYWGVPQSILVNEMLPKLQRNPGYLDNNGYEVATYGGKKLSSRQINWSQYSDRIPFNIRQKPGSKNALGEMKILFPNKHAIYMHDTPAKNLFSRASRAFSHGCVRLADPRAMAAILLNTSKSDIGQRIAGGENKQIKISNKIPVYIAYFTAWQNENGEIAFYDDMYDRDDHLKKALENVRQVRDAGV